MRDWVDALMHRFVEMFGAESLLVITPTQECFPDDWNSPDECAEVLFAGVCGYMGVERSDVNLLLVANGDRERDNALRNSMPNFETDQKGAAGLYVADAGEDKPLIVVSRDQLASLDNVIGTMAHELGHVQLLGGGKIERDTRDMEPLTDLLTVFRGFGIFKANAAKTFAQYNDGVSQGYRVSTQGYLSERTFGYALAVFAQIRGDLQPQVDAVFEAERSQLLQAIRVGAGVRGEAEMTLLARMAQ